MPPSLEPKTILIADDAESQRGLIEILLSSNRLKLVSLTNGKEVLEYLRTNTPDLALLDSDMPYLGGFDIGGKMKRIRRLAHVPVVVLTPPHALDEVEKSRQLAQMVQVDLVIQKPLSDKNLRQQIVDLLEVSRAKAETAPPAVTMPHTSPVPDDEVSPSRIPILHHTVGDEKNLTSTLLIENALEGMHTLHGDDGVSSDSFPHASTEQKIALLESENKLLRQQVAELDHEVLELRKQLGKVWE